MNCLLKLRHMQWQVGPTFTWAALAHDRKFQCATTSHTYIQRQQAIYPTATLPYHNPFKYKSAFLGTSWSPYIQTGHANEPLVQKSAVAWTKEKHKTTERLFKYNWMESMFMNFKVTWVSYVNDIHHILVKMQQDKTKMKWSEPALQAQKGMWKREDSSRKCNS
jgi:hypothetical protein